ncbi:unnamed protein product [Acanthosepion pharaonis]|uniref:Uncharacterized protein n=1 Tax=Acanthosepion pharaonis TaxID=158019 RepID=A0A812BD00_ACAPH|nr:unnamed protein product [Sepia pharaonis]
MRLHRFNINFYSHFTQHFYNPSNGSYTTNIRTSATEEPNTVNVAHAEQATAEEHIITPVTDDHIASTSTYALHCSVCRGDDQPGSSAKAAKQPGEATLAGHRKATRNAADAPATSIRRSQETTAEKTARNAAKAAATSIRRSQESMAEKTARHAADAAATSAARASESSAQKRTRRQRDAISTSAARAVEGPTERLERLQTVN